MFTMKKLLLPLIVFLSSCVHAPVVSPERTVGSPGRAKWPAVGPAPTREQLDMKDQANQWMSGDDFVIYNRRANRKPSNKKVWKYGTQGTCGGFPRVNVQTAPGFCLGLVFDGSAVFKKSRWIAALDENRIVVVDMGGWGENAGKFYTLDLSQQPVQAKLLMERSMVSQSDPGRGIFDRPNQILKHTDGKFYVGAATGVYRFNPLAKRPEETIETLIRNLPSAGIHPLKSFTFDEAGGFYVNVGAASNVCQNFTRVGDSNPERNPRNYQHAQFPNCPEGENLEVGQAQVRRYSVLPNGRLSKEFTVFAKGLRNSVGLLWDPYRKAILQTENGRDAIGKFAPQLVTADLPHEEINVLLQGRHYGWPYCYDNNVVSPEWPNIDCSNGFTTPQTFLPAHAAPLGMILHSGQGWPEWYKGRLLIALHGYEKKGHRIVAMKRDDEGLPIGVPQSLVFGWDERGEQGVGKPVSLLEMKDGSVLIAEDDEQNKILKLVYDPTQGNGVPVQEIDQANAPIEDENLPSEEVLKARLEEKLRAGPSPFVMFQTKVVDKYCAECHAAAGAPGVRLLKFDDEGNAFRIRQAGKAADLLEILKGTPGYISMPPQGWDSPDEQKQAVDWFRQWIQTGN